MCEAYDLGVVLGCALGEGFQTGKYDRDDISEVESREVEDDSFGSKYLSDEIFEMLDVLQKVAADIPLLDDQFERLTAAKPGSSPDIVGSPGRSDR